MYSVSREFLAGLPSHDDVYQSRGRRDERTHVVTGLYKSVQQISLPECAPDDACIRSRLRKVIHGSPEYPVLVHTQYEVCAYSVCKVWDPRRGNSGTTMRAAWISGIGDQAHLVPSFLHGIQTERIGSSLQGLQKW